MVQYFIEITPQDRFRTEILTAQKTLLECLKRCEIFKQTRDKKVKEIENLRSVLKEVAVLSKEFNSEMPKVKIKFNEREYAREEKPKRFHDYNKELEKLEFSIEEIEKKLKDLGK